MFENQRLGDRVLFLCLTTKISLRKTQNSQERSGYLNDTYHRKKIQRHGYGDR